MADLDQLLVDQAEGVSTVTLNRPRAMNALGTPILRELLRVADRLDGDPAVRAVLLTGAGERAFSAGADLKETGQLDGEGLRRFVLLDFRCKARLAQMRKPLVAAIRGYALGGGLELALSCDVRFAATDAVLGFPEIGLGTVAGSGGIQRLAPVVGRGIAADLLLTGRKIGAEEAWRIGLVNYLCEPADLLSQAAAYARSLAEKNPVAVQGTKAALQETISLAGLDAGYQSLLSQACRVGGRYRQQVDEFLDQKDRET